jgi:hypothetical protein
MQDGLAGVKRETAQSAPDSLRLQEARDLFLDRNGFKVQDYTAPTVKIGILGRTFTFPNTRGRKRIVHLHDLHHVLTGYRTNWTGEAEIGAWELRAGCHSFTAYALNGLGVILGVFIAPTRVVRAFQAAAGHRTLYRDSIAYDSLLQMTVGEVRNRLGIPPGGVFQIADTVRTG